MNAPAVDWSVRPAEAGDGPGAVDVAVRAFANDPSHHYFFPDRERYRAQASAFHGYLFAARLARGAVYVAVPPGAGPLAVSVWDVPDGWNPAGSDPAGSAADAAWSATELWHVAVTIMGPEAAARVEAYGDLVHARLPSEPHWYLGVLATDPAHQGQGLGRAVIEPVRRRADDEGVPIVLETSTPANRDLYRHLGFEVFDSFEIEDVLPVWVMRRPPGAGVWR